MIIMEKKNILLHSTASIYSSPKSDVMPMAHAKKGPFLLFLCVRLQGASQTFYPEGLIPRRIPLVVISTIEKKSQKNKHLVGFRYYVIQNTSI